MVSPKDVSTLFKLKRRIFEYIAVIRSPETPWYVKGLAVGAFLYLLSPVDLIPDMIPILGVTDDAALLGLFLSYLNRFVTDDIRQSVSRRMGGE
nr:DUF1232 domain-containing protein [uncultured Desulfuromonas sp.]